MRLKLLNYDNVLLVESLLASNATSTKMVELCLIHGMMHQEWEIRLRHVLRSQNEVADCMAKMTTRLASLQLFVAPPKTVKDVLLEDCKKAFVKRPVDVIT
ncbi:hypothetical protein PVK06_006590 [Gossypium arboreum]|uniref:RNase H type-1 domain-containing protein n=1 Tax=Gossypium arboreum TaxID=29729 RepID=A0ABR0QGA9_GOSAR|nr:hypothetical protein PVK06_006590 [Gossypium arboreum]